MRVFVFLMVFLAGSVAVADDKALFDFVKKMEQFKAHRAQYGIPALSDDDIKDIIDGDGLHAPVIRGTVPQKTGSAICLFPDNHGGY